MCTYLSIIPSDSMLANQSQCLRRQVAEYIRLHQLKNGPWYARHPRVVAGLWAISACAVASAFVALYFWGATVLEHGESPALITVLVAILLVGAGSALISGCEAGSPQAPESFLAMLIEDPRLPGAFRARISQILLGSSGQGLTFGALIEVACEVQDDKNRPPAMLGKNFCLHPHLAGESE